MLERQSFLFRNLQGLNRMSLLHRLLPEYLWSIYTCFENANGMLLFIRFPSSRGLGNGPNTERILKFREEAR